jgi:hypothetical protein
MGEQGDRVWDIIEKVGVCADDWLTESSQGQGRTD